MATIADLRMRLQDRGYGIDTVDTQNRFLEEAYVRLQNLRRWDWLQDYVSLPVPANTSTVPLLPVYTAQPFTRLESVLNLTDEQNPEFLSKDQFDQVRENGGLLMSGTPRFWTTEGHGASSSTYRGSVELWPRTDKAITLGLRLYRRLPTFTAIGSGDVPVPDELLEWIIWQAVAGIAFRERDVESRQLALQEADQLLTSYLAQHGMKQRQHASSVVSSGWHEAYTEIDWMY